jgi:nuclear protein localization family protein 4
MDSKLEGSNELCFVPLSMIIRVRTNIGVWRVEDLDPATATPSDVIAGIAATRPHVVYETPLSSDPRCDVPLDASTPLSSQGFGHGSMVHCRVDPSTCAENTVVASSAAGAAAVGGADVSMTDADRKSEGGGGGGGGGITKRVIGKDGSIRLVHAEGCSVGAERGFRKGMLSLRDMKMAWTLAEFAAMDEKYNFKIKRQDASFVGSGGLHLESSAVSDFQSYLRRFQFQQQRFGYLYGRFVNEEGQEEDEETEKKEKRKDKMPNGWGARMPESEEKKVKKNAKVIVEAIYEPPQEPDSEAAEGFVILEDPNEENVENLAKMLGLQKVGWIVGHPPREEGFQLSSAEVIMAAELQLESAGGIEPTPFVTVRVTVGDDGNVVVEAFQVSLQCMEMVAEEALDVGPNPGFCYVNETFTAIQEGKASSTVENNFFLTLVPINGYQSDTFVSMFPRVNRAYDDRAQTHDEMRRQLSKSGQSGWTFIDLLSDFALLLYLCKFLDARTDMPKICASVTDRENVPLDDGYKIIISSMAGMDGSY